MKNAINWFEIPSTDFDRAVNFYSSLLGVEIAKNEFMGEPQAFFPSSQSQTAVGGAIVKSDRLIPSETGTLIYLNLETIENLDRALATVESAGGKLIMPKTDIGDPGFIGIIIDSEGNKIGLHSNRVESVNS
jgi:uncharacterized protein